jgi:glycosyltransferase involved in cell wall biosynthesis
MKRLVFTVTNDLNYDQRMIRICTSLTKAGYNVMLVGRKMKGSIPLQDKPYKQKRLLNLFEKGKAFYIENNIRLFFLLLFNRMDLICAIDLDTILPCYFASKVKGTKRVYDAHELFCEMKEIITRPKIYKAWKKIERFAVPKFKYGYTVNSLIRDEFKKMYGREYEIIRSLPVLKPLVIPEKKTMPAGIQEKYILYQGAVNEGRSFETLIPAFKNINARLLIAGDGNFMEQAKKLVMENKLEQKLIFLGKLMPGKLAELTASAWIGLTLFENKGLSNYYSLANRFFDYIHAGIPQLCVDYPAYAELNNHYNIAILIKDLSSDNIAKHLNKLIEDEDLYTELQENCMKAREKLNWQEEEKKLLSYYKFIFD